MKRKLVIILICILLIIVIIFLVTKNYNSNTNTTINAINNGVSEENLIENIGSLEDITNEVIDVTNVKDEFFSRIGKITDITDNVISFEEQENGKKYIITVSDNAELIDARTEEKIDNISSVEIGDVIDLVKDKEQLIIGIAKNLSSESLKRDLLINLSLKSPKLDVQQMPGIEKINIINKDKAIVTIKFSDIYGSYFNNEEEFTEDVIVNPSTEINSKSGLAYNVETLNNAEDGIITIILDRKTLNSKEPTVIYYGQSDT